jgi:hypothetical protein
MPGGLRTLATSAVAEAAKLATEAILAATTGTPASLIGVAGSMVKSVVDEVLKAASQLERKIDVLLGEPLRSGLHFLGDAFLHSSDSDTARASRDQLLDQSYESFVKAVALAEASGEDPLLIEAVATLALALRTGRQSLAMVRVQQVRPLIGLMLERAAASEALADKASAAAALPSPPPVPERPGREIIRYAVLRDLYREADDFRNTATALRIRAAALTELLALSEAVVQSQSRSAAPPNNGAPADAGKPRH